MNLKKKCYCANVCLCFCQMGAHTRTSIVVGFPQSSQHPELLIRKSCFCVSVFYLFFPRLLLQQCTETIATPVVLSVTVKWTTDASRSRQEVWSYRWCLHPPHLNIWTRIENKGRSTVSSFIFYDTSASSEMSSLFCSNSTAFFLLLLSSLRWT